MKRKICHITSVHNRYDIRILRKECTSLAKNGYDVTLLVNDNQPDEIINKVKIVSSNFMPRNRLRRIIFSNKYLYKKAIEIDAEIYHIHDPELLPVGNKLKRKGKKVIFDSHENYTMQIKEKYYIPKLLRKLISYVYFKYETYSVKKFDSVIIPCTFNNINPFEKRAKRTVFVDNLPIIDELYNKYNPNAKKERTICYLGTLTYDRGVTHLVKAAYKAKARLILGGKFYPAGYYNIIKSMKEYSCVDYRGFVSNVAEIYEESAIGISTILNTGQYNKGDNFATKVYEYMAMELPVIISDYPYVRDVLKQYEFGIAVNPENIEEIADAIIFLLNNPKVSQKMGHEGRRAIKEKFNWSIEVNKLLLLYKNI